MKEIAIMTADEMAAEMRTYECKLSHGFAFISYSHMDRAKVYPVVLGWMRAGYNIYIDLDFEKHGSDQHWVSQMRSTLARSTCCLAVCFKSLHYTYSYAALLELLTIRSGNTTNRHRGKLLCVDSVTLELVPSDQDEIPAPLETMYQEYFGHLKLSMGQRFAGQNIMERDTLLAGLDDWLFHMEPGTKARLLYSRISANQLMENIDETYTEGMREFFPYIARLIKNWFDSQNLNGNDISPQTDNRDRFAQVGVERIREPTVVPAPVAATPPPPALVPKPESAPMPKTTYKAGNASVSKQKNNPSPQPQSIQRPNPQPVPKVQPVSTPDMEIEDGVLVKYDGPGGDIAIPEGITKIGYEAFRGCKGLRTIIIPEGVTVIETLAFYGCLNLERIVLPETLSAIGECAFEDCESLISVIIPKGITRIDGRAFEFCINPLAHMFENMFNEGKASPIRYTGPKIPIGRQAFSGCKSLVSVTIPEGVTTIELGTFKGCKNLTSIKIPKSVTTIEFGAFSGCESLVSVTILEGVTTIGSETFEGCKNLTSIKIPKGVIAIDTHSFLGCASLVDVTIPEGVTRINDGAFADCQGLRYISIPVSVSRIADDAFWGSTDRLTIHTCARSYAHKYAKKHNIPVKLI